MNKEALQQKVGPALQAAFSQVGAELVNHAVKINTLEHEVRMLKIRTAWTAKRTLVARNFPEWATAADRELTVAEALKENNLGHLEWDLTTTTMEGTDGKKFLAPISILTVQTYGAHKKVMDACSRAVVRYWREDTEKKKTGEGEKSVGSQDAPGKASDADPKDDDMGEGSKAGSSQKVWEIKTWNWNLPVKMAPGITQFERRAPRLDECVPAALRPLQEGGPGAAMDDPHPGGQGGCLAGKKSLQPQSLEPHRNDGHSGGLEV